MRTIILASVACMAVAGYTTGERVASGAAVGAVVAGPVGAVAGAAVGYATAPRYCYVRGRGGRLYPVRC
ncbi:MAG: hypothetical protein M3145_11330 [Pseudomonadota bacterium]|nr:hypothetical protein [Pseudomonadota bacterium]